jgi:hypothetical protein
LRLGPVTTFERACARCHGSEGSFYGRDFARLTEADLRKYVLDMMEGPGQLDPSPAAVAAMVAYHRAIAAGEPFLCVTEYRPGGRVTPTLAGEASPEASVQLVKGEREKRLVVSQEGRWVEPEPPRAPFVLRAKLRHAHSALNFPEQQWTHATR